jgi:predicted amidohydrolase YtcJ
MRSMLAAGIPMQFGSDGPVNPFRNIQLAEQHPTNPPEAITRDQAIAAYTHATLVRGQPADLAVLTGDVDDPETRSVLTIVGGEVVYEASANPSPSPASGPPSARTE